MTLPVAAASDSSILDVVIGLSFLYFVLSLVSSAVNETVASIFSWRAEFLERGIRNLLTDQDLVDKVFAYPLVASLRRRVDVRRGDRRPSYLPSRTFAVALLDTLAPAAVPGGQASHDVLAKVEKSVGAIEQREIRDALAVLLREARGDLDAFREGVETWFDNAMDRVSGWYRRRVHLFLWIWAAVLVLALNADSLQFARSLWSDRTLRAAVVAQAQKTPPTSSSTSSGKSAAARAADEVNEVKQLKLPLGWSLKQNDPRRVPSWGGVPGKILGLLITAAALTLGAPFWFDLLGKLARLRTSGPRPKRE